jgi:hypothetical protein
MHCTEDVKNGLQTFLTFSFSDTAAAVAIELLPLPSHRPEDPSRTDPNSCLLDWLQLATAGTED